MQKSYYKKIIPFIIFFLVFGSCQRERGKVNDTCIKFMKGRVALENGDSTLLKSVTEPMLFRIIKLNQEYIEIVNAPVTGPNLNIRPKSVTIEGNCATCLMSSMEYYIINLCKEEGEWQVKGENYNYPTTERVQKAKKKIIEQNAYLKNKPLEDSVLKIIDSFFNKTNQYFEGHDIGIFKGVCTETSINFIERLRGYAKERTGTLLLWEEMEKPKYLTASVSQQGNIITCKFYNEETTILLKRNEDSYVITGFNGISSEKITNQLMKRDYIPLLRALKLTRSEKYRNKEIK